MTYRSFNYSGVRISSGNTKLGNTSNVSLTPIESCPPKVPCTKDCYAARVFHQYPAVRKAWRSNHTIAKEDRQRFFRSIGEFLSDKNPIYFRWHVGGDILDQDYLDRMKATASNYPYTQFLAYTKQHSLDYHYLPQNLRIFASLWLRWGIEDECKAHGLDQFAYVYDKHKHDARIDEDSRVFICPGQCCSCRFCWDSTHSVVFARH